MSAEQVDTVVIGAGVVGLAVARALALQGREVMVLEAADAFGTGTSARSRPFSGKRNRHVRRCWPRK